MSTSRAAAGESHPGEIAFDDQTTGRRWTSRPTEVPATMAWVVVSGSRRPVTRIVISGTPGLRRFTKYGADGAMLETTTQAPPPARGGPTPTAE
jgi:hypothetical protein